MAASGENMVRKWRREIPAPGHTIAAQWSAGVLFGNRYVAALSNLSRLLKTGKSSGNSVVKKHR